MPKELFFKKMNLVEIFANAWGGNCNRKIVQLGSRGEVKGGLLATRRTWYYPSYKNELIQMEIDRTDLNCFFFPAVERVDYSATSKRVVFNSFLLYGNRIFNGQTVIGEKNCYFGIGMLKRKKPLMFTRSTISELSLSRKINHRAKNQF
jgi:hypothetical protein